MLIRSIEEKAEKLLHEYNLFYNPVDVFKLAEDLGVNVQSVDLDYEVSGFFALKNNIPYIRLNRLEKTNRQRFTVAHELGHYLLHSNEVSLFVDKSEKLLYRDAESSTGTKIKEREANAFAAALLMPKQLLLKTIDSLKEEVEEDSFLFVMAKLFNVSEQAMAIRLSNLELLEFGLF